MAIKIGIVGLGGRGRDWVREVRASPAFEVAACVEIDQAVLQSACLELQIPALLCFPDLENALDRVTCEAVIVATSVDQHVTACEAALSRKIAVLVEKPFTLKLNEAVKLVSLAEATGTMLLVAQNYRYMRSFRTARRLIQEGLLGNVSMVVMQYYRVPHEMAASLAKLPNSVLWGMGVHHLDVIRFILGKEATGVWADSFTATWGQLRGGASFQAMLSMEDEARVFYTATYESSGHEFFERGQEFYARLVGERATLHVFQRWLVLCEKGKLPRIVRRGPRKISEERILLDQLERALLNREVPASSGRDNLQTMAIVEACLLSAAERTWVNPQELLRESR
jgi:predicted dehydrogenase